MRVFLATQVLSDSVADAIEFCRDVLKHPDFINSSGTCDFLRTFNRIFDLLDSKMPFGKNHKVPLRKENKALWTATFEETKNFILGLHYGVVREQAPKRRKKECTVLTGPRKRCFIGFLVNMISYASIFEIYVEKRELLQYILGHKMSQDHLELMFGLVRSSLGSNNNPTVLQFKSSFRKMILGASHVGLYENCMVQDETEILLPAKLKKNISLVEETYALEDDNSVELYLERFEQENSSEFQANILNYIAGYIQKKIVSKEMCVYCHEYLQNMESGNAKDLLRIKNRGGLTAPTRSFERIVRISNTLLTPILLKSNLFSEKNLVNNIAVQVCNIVNELHPDLFQNLDKHVENLGSHKNKMVKKIVSLFVTMRAKHHCKLQNSQSTKVRVQLSKLILFKNQ